MKLLLKTMPNNSVKNQKIELPSFSEMEDCASALSIYTSPVSCFVKDVFDVTWGGRFLYAKCIKYNLKHA